MAAARPLMLHVEVGDPETAWCDRCALPSALRFPVVLLSVRGVSATEATVCRDCTDREP